MQRNTSFLAKIPAYLLPAPLVCLLLFWRLHSVWFLNDDFAWLGLPLEFHSAHDLWAILFKPEAQGTIRVLSDRLYFLVFSSVFGLNPLPFRLWALATWFADLALAAAIGARLTGSRAAGALGAMLWTSSASVVRALAWASAYDQLLCSLCILSAFYARLRWLDTGSRKWKIAEWAAYLTGFGALESIVMYPLIAALHGWCTGRRKIADIAWLAVPAAAFTALHLFFIPPDPNYPIKVDLRMPSNFLHYLGWAIGPRLLGDFPGRFHARGVIAVAAIGAALAVFVVWCLLRREFIAVFYCGWFALTLAPVLPLPNNVQDYYLTIPVLGLAWLAGWGLVSAWNGGWIARGIALAALLLYLPASVHHIGDGMSWFVNRTNRFKTVVFGLRDASLAHPGSVFALEGVDSEVYQSGFEEDAFRLIGLNHVYVIHPVGSYAIAPRYTAPPEKILEWCELGQARVLAVGVHELRDVTADEIARLRAEGTHARYPFVDVSDPAYAARLGDGWYTPEPGYRWMGKTATVEMSGSASAAPKLRVTGFAPALALASGPVTVRFRSGSREIGSAMVSQPDQMFSLEFPLPPELARQDDLAITIDVSKMFRAPGDPRDLGLPFKSFEVR